MLPFRHRALSALLPPGVPPAEPLRPHHQQVRIRILSQNLYGAEEHEPKRRAAAFAAALEVLLPDVVALQEVRRFNILPLLSSTILRSAYPKLSEMAVAEPPWTLVLTRASSHLQWVSQRHYLGVGAWRGMDVLHANVSGRPCSFASVHLSAFDCPAAANSEAAAIPKAEDGDVVEEPEHPADNATSLCPGGVTRVADLRNALTVLARDGAHDAVLMGDFNFGSRRDLFALELDELRRHHEWRDAWTEARRHDASGGGRGGGSLSHAAGWTWDNARNGLNKRDSPNAPLNFPSDRIDRVLLRGGLHAHASSLFNEAPLPASASSPPLFVSDHFGVLVDVTLGELSHHVSMAHHSLRGMLTLRPRAPLIEGSPSRS